VVVVVAGDDDSRLDFGVDGMVYGGNEERILVISWRYRPRYCQPGRELNGAPEPPNNKDSSVSHRFGDQLLHLTFNLSIIVEHVRQQLLDASCIENNEGIVTTV
jgi:hypothetical protein